MNRVSRHTGFVFLLALASGWLIFELGRTKSAPLIGIASLSDENYIRAVREAGGIPLILNSKDSLERIEDYLVNLDGLLMPGGADIPPAEYGETPHETVKLIDEERLHFEKALINAWIQRTDKPLLGICLGCQWINVASGGSLVQDIPSEFKVNHRKITHPVILEAGSRLSEIFGTTNLSVNSLHHQAVRRIGKGLKIVGKCPDGIVEAIETTDPDRFMIGVQWHPEKVVPEDHIQAKLFRTFIEASNQRKKQTHPILK